MLKLLRNAAIAALVFISASCSDSRSSSNIPFTQAFAPGSAFGSQTKVSKIACDDAVVEVLDGKTPDYTASRSYNILYGNPSLMASVQCMDSVGDAKTTYEKAVEKLRKHPLRLDVHEDLKMSVPATGYWTDKEDSAKQVMFRYGNLVVIVQTLYSSAIPVSDVRDFAENYVKYLDSVAGVK